VQFRPNEPHYASAGRQVAGLLDNASFKQLLKRQMREEQAVARMPGCDQFAGHSPILDGSFSPEGHLFPDIHHVHYYIIRYARKLFCTTRRSSWSPVSSSATAKPSACSCGTCSLSPERPSPVAARRCHCRPPHEPHFTTCYSVCARCCPG
jgi:hypothetical protein